MGKYEESLERAKSKLSEYKEVVEYIFPELKESEDEEIKEMLKVAVERTPWMQDKKEKCYEWLEAQGEQKPTDKVEPRFKVGDKIKLAKEPKYPVREIIAIKNDAYYFDRLVHLPFSHQNDWELVEQKSSWSEEDEYNMLTTISSIDYDIRKENEEKKQQIFWLKSLKERVLPQPKQERNEEEQQIIKDAASFILSCVNIAETKEEEERLEKLADKLQDLRLQKGWKPSDEQMSALRVLSLNCESQKQFDIIGELIEQLKVLQDDTKSS